METGAPKYRRRVTYIPETFTGNITLTSAQCATLDTFYRTTLKMTGVFDWKDFRSGSTATYGFTKMPAPKSDQGYPGYWVVQLSLLKVSS